MKKQYIDGKGNYINSLEGFRAYMKRKLALKGGIHKERLHLFLGEHLRRYNHRSDPEKIKMRKIIQRLEKIWR